MLKVLCVFGTRPEAIKMAPIVREIRRYPNRIAGKVCVTAQHRQMLDQVLSFFQIQPEYDLDVMRSNQTLVSSAANIMLGLDTVLKAEQPDWVLVQGDTTTVMAGAVASFYNRVKVGHVEAGLRSFDKWQPYPEEINRKIVTATADLHFAPTTVSRDNLLREGVADSDVVVTGNTGIDALKWAAEQSYDPEAGALAGIPWHKNIILVTAHRRENQGEPLREICSAILRLAERYQNTHFVYPVHLNPHVRGVVHAALKGHPQVSLLDPLEYRPLVYLMSRSVLVLTDSGGIQEEAPGLGKPVLVLRETTERPEAIDAGTALLVGADAERIIVTASMLLDDPVAYAAMAKAVNPFGDGQAAERVVSSLLER